ncbi:MAG: hypothetical protein ABIP39_03850, partial [Polyangiaceae bacterium]
MRTTHALVALLAASAIAGCSSDDDAKGTPGSPDSPGGDGGAAGSDGATSAPDSGTTPNPQSGPAAGNPDGHEPIPTEAQVEDVSSPTTVVGTGTPASCTGDAFVTAVAKGGVITFDCGAAPATIVLTSTAKVFNDKGTKLVIDGGNKVTLSGGGTTRILYMSTCDKAQVYPPGPGDCNTNPGV